MKALSCLGLLLALSLSGLCTEPPPSPPPAGQESNLVWDGGIKKSSSMENGQTQISESFRFKNTSQENVTITSVTASCGCTVPGYTKDPIPPQGSGEITLVYSSKMPGVGRVVSANVIFQSGEQTKIEWNIQNAPNPSYFSPVTMPTQVPLVEWKPGQKGELSVRIDLPPGTKITDIPENANVNTSFEEISPGTGTYMIKFSRKNDNPFWGAVSIQTSSSSSPPYRINIRALR
jgi:hypothetical protein